MADWKSMELVDGEQLHVETPLGVINIQCGLTDMKGRKIDSVTVTPDEYADELKVVRRGLHNTRLVQLKTMKRHFGAQKV